MKYELSLNMCICNAAECYQSMSHSSLMTG